MTSLIERLAGKGTGKTTKYQEELVYNAPTVVQNTAMSIAKKAENNILHVMIVSVIVLLPDVLQNTPAKIPHGLLKVPSTLVIK